MTRSSRLLAVGVLILLLALVVMLLAMRQDGGTVIVNEPASAADVTDDVAAADEPAATDTGTVGALGDDEDRLPQPLTIPEGHEAVAVTVPYQAGVAGLPTPGDDVNLYGLFENGLPEQLADPRTVTTEEDEPFSAAGRGVVRVLNGVEVLGVSGAEAASGGGSITLVLALEPGDAERVIYLAGIERVWFSLVTEGHEPVDGAGVTRDTVLDDVLG